MLALFPARKSLGKIELPFSTRFFGSSTLTYLGLISQTLRKTYKLQPQHLGLPAVLRHVTCRQADAKSRCAMDNRTVELEPSQFTEVFVAQEELCKT